MSILIWISARLWRRAGWIWGKTGPPSAVDSPGAFITALAVLGLAIVNALPNDRLSWRPGKNSFQLKKNVDSKLTDAVVKISVVSRRQGLLRRNKTGNGFYIDPSGIIYNKITTSSRTRLACQLHFRTEGLRGRPLVKPAGSGPGRVRLAGGNLRRCRWILPGRSLGDKIRVVGTRWSWIISWLKEKLGSILKSGQQGKIFSIDAPIYPVTAAARCIIWTARLWAWYLAAWKRIITAEQGQRAGRVYRWGPGFNHDQVA
jgi:hypothetical protein